MKEDEVKLNFYYAGKIVRFLPSSLSDRKIFAKFALLTEFNWLTQEVIFWIVFTEQGWPKKELVDDLILNYFKCYFKLTVVMIIKDCNLN